MKTNVEHAQSLAERFGRAVAIVNNPLLAPNRVRFVIANDNGWGELLDGEEIKDVITAYLAIAAE